MTPGPDLDRHLAAIRGAAASLRLPEVRRERIMREFAETRSRARVSWRFAVAVAALLVMTIGIGRDWRAAPDYFEEAADEGFIAVPYAPPLAAGEFVKIVRTELQPIEIARMGLPVDMAHAADIAADVLVGEDGLPRAVRVIEE